jgi:hypothetical protein
MYRNDSDSNKEPKMIAEKERFEPTGRVIERLTGRKPTAATIARFTRTGFNGCVLKTVRLGLRKLTRESWVIAWMHEISEKEASEASEPSKKKTGGKKKQAKATSSDA